MIKLEFQINILLLSFAITVVLGLIIVPILRKLKVGQIERSDGPESHLKKQGTPTMGGIIIMLGIIIVTVGAYIYYKLKNPELAQKNLLLLEDIMNEMRKDLGLRKTKKGNLLAFFVNDIKKAIKSMK